MSLPQELARALLDDTARTWMSIRDIVPAGAYFGGGTAITVHLRHRVSRDLGFFLAEPIDLEDLAEVLQSIGKLIVQQLYP